jgi:ribosome-binding factor A
MSLINSGNYVQKYLETQLIDNTYLKYWPTINYTKNHTLSNITKFQLIITSELGNLTP